MKKYSLLSLVFVANMLSGKELIQFENPRELINIIKSYLPKNPVIVEAGAYDGSDSVFLAESFGRRCRIYSFEAVPYLYTIAKATTQHYRNIVMYNMALADICGIKPFYLSNLGDNPTVTASSSLLKPKDHLIYSPDTYFNTQIEVECTTIDEWAHKNTIEKVDFLWLDLQGFELNVLKASPAMLKNVKAILTEIEFVEAYEGQALYQELKEWLENQGFELIALSNVRGWFGDALFVRG